MEIFNAFKVIVCSLQLLEKLNFTNPHFFKPKLCVLPFPNVSYIPKKETYKPENDEKGISKWSINASKENDIFFKRLPECGSSSLSEGPAFINRSTSKSQGKLSGLKDSFSSRLHIL